MPVGRQLPRFLIVGALNVLITFTVYQGASNVLAAPLAWGAGAANGYVLNVRWTSAARDTRRARILYPLVRRELEHHLGGVLEVGVHDGGLLRIRRRGGPSARRAARTAPV